MTSHDHGCFEPLETTERDVGVKAGRLRSLLRLGIPVPDAVVLPHGAGLDDDVLRRDVDRLLATRFAGLPVVVRSSASDEDAAIARAPGVYDSFLDRRTTDEVLESIAACRSAIASREARDYRAMMGLPAHASMHVVVQRMVRTESSGVLDTPSPLRHPPRQLVEWTDGLGTPVVSGEGRTSVATLPRGGAVDEAVPAAAMLVDLGLRLERHFGRPQEIEWGLAAGRLVVFQSRDAVLPDAAAATGPVVGGRACRPLSVGYAVGGPGSLFGGVAMLDEPPGPSELRSADDLAAIVVRRGGPCSHSASMCRERALPTVQAATEIAPDALYAIDALHGTICELEALTPATRKHVVLAAARTAARRGVGGWTSARTYEAVVLDPLDQALLHEALLGDRAPDVVRQTIVPFDDPARTYTGTSIRLQRTDGVARLQLKRATPLPDRPMRLDEEVRLDAVDEPAVTASLAAMGFVPFPEQERIIERWSLDDLSVQRIAWPGAQHPYLGIEAPEPSLLLARLAAAGLDPAMLAPLDGKELFDLLGVRLDDARFEEVRHVA